MKSWNRVRIVGFVSWVLFFVSFQCSGQEQFDEQPRTLTLAADIWCPYNCTPDSEQPGYIVELAQNIFTEHNLRVHYVTMPWSRALALVHAGAIDGVIGATRADAAGLLIGSIPQGLDTTVVATRPDAAWTYQGPASLDGKRVGFIQDYTYDNAGPLDSYLALRLQNAPATLTRLTGNRALTQLIAMLERGHIDAFLANEAVLSYVLSHDHRTGVVRTIRTGQVNEVFIAFSVKAKNERLVAILDAGMLRYHQSGRLAKLLARYGLQDWLHNATPTVPFNKNGAENATGRQ